jgi:hypothetical protein
LNIEAGKQADKESDRTTPHRYLLGQ